MAIAIIGAGLAGLTAAQHLAAGGHTVIVFEKSKGLGGRMATRCVGGVQFDHGAQYFRAKNQPFRDQIRHWQAQGCVAEWGDGAFVGTPRMTSPASFLAHGLQLRCNETVTALAQTPQGWAITTAEQQQASQSLSTVILAIPAPQAIALVATANIAMPELHLAHYAPCWAMMLSFAAQDMPTIATGRVDDPMISWIANDSQKPDRSNAVPTLVIHATAAWSREHLELSQAEAGHRLLSRFQQFIGHFPNPLLTLTHRWRYALVEKPVGAPYLWQPKDRIGACGDWCLGSKVEDAYDSGRAMAAAVLADTSA